jgi:hypothetical protein
VGDTIADKAPSRWKSDTEELVWYIGRRCGGSYSGLLKSKGDGGTSSVTTVADEKAVVLVWEWDSGPAPAPACEMIRWVMQGGSVRERCGVRRRR